MNLTKSAKLICELRKSRRMTQKQVADILGIEPKTVSKWENGRGFPDVSCVAELAEIFGVSEKALLTGELNQNGEEVGNMRKTAFYVCPHCGSFVSGTGEFMVNCCGTVLRPLDAMTEDGEHIAEINETDGEFYIKFNHEMSKEHYIGFVSYVSYDRVMTVRLYPEQDSEVRMPKMYGGKFYFYCNRHGLFEQTAEIEKKEKKGKSSGANMTALMSAFARAYHFKHSENPVFADELSEKLLGKADYGRIEKFIADAKGDVAAYVNEYLAPTPLARAKFCDDVLKNEVRTGARQYVILGCGLDTFSLGDNAGKIEVFEIDTAEMIDDKLRRIKRAGLKSRAHCIAADLSRDDIETVLEENGFDFGKKTVFSCLGLLYYLTKEEISALFEKISGFAADGSTVVFDFADNHLFSSQVPRVADTVRMAQMSGNPMKSCFGYGELELLLQKHGFLIYEFLNNKDIGKYFANSDEISAFEHINFALAALQRKSTN